MLSNPNSGGNPGQNFVARILLTLESLLLALCLGKSELFRRDMAVRGGIEELKFCPETRQAAKFPLIFALSPDIKKSKVPEVCEMKTLKFSFYSLRNSIEARVCPPGIRVSPGICLDLPGPAGSSGEGARTYKTHTASPWHPSPLC